MGRPVRWLARAGYAAHGVVYVTLGILAGMVATGARRGRLDGKGALHELHDQPFGQALLAVVAVGLGGYALWKAVQATLDPEREASGSKGGWQGAFKRVGWALGALMHGALVVYAVGLLTGSMTGGSGGGKAKSWSAKIMSWDPYGAWVVGVIGVVLLGVASWQLWTAWKAKLDERLDLATLAPTWRSVVIHVSRFGIAARGVVWGLIGVGLVVAGMNADPHRVQDAAESLDRLRHLSYGYVLLLVVACGLAAYGVYELIEARYRRIRPL